MRLIVQAVTALASLAAMLQGWELIADAARASLAATAFMLVSLAGAGVCFGLELRRAVRQELLDMRLRKVLRTCAK